MTDDQYQTLVRLGAEMTFEGAAAYAIGALDRLIVGHDRPLPP